MRISRNARLLLLAAPVAFVGMGGRNARPQAPDGEAIAAELGCGGCHAGMPPAGVIQDRAPALADPATPLPSSFIFEYLANPVRRRTDIGLSRMPDFRLAEDERLALALFLGDDDGSLSSVRARHPGVDAESGRRVFTALNCAGCHRHPTVAAARRAPDLSEEGAAVLPEWLRGWLADPAPIRPHGLDVGGGRMPDFRFSTREVDALAAYLSSLDSSGEDADLPAMSPYLAHRTETLFRNRYSCLGCHRLGGEGGDIGPPLDGVGWRLKPARVLAMILDPAGTVAGTAMPRLPLTDRDARRVAAYLIQRDADRVPAPVSSLATPEHPALLRIARSDAPEGERLYARHCAACHGVGGLGNGWNASNLPVSPTSHANAALMSRRVDDALFDGIHAGAFVLDGSPRMPAFGAMLSPGEIRALVGYIRTLCACRGPDWSRDGR